MAEGGAVSKCRFVWHIIQPFVPTRMFEAIFYHGSGTPFRTEWKVILDPVIIHNLKEVTYRLTIRCLQPEGSEEVIEVKRIQAIMVLMKESSGGRYEEFDYVFSLENQHSFVREYKVRNLSERWKKHLEVEIELDFPNEPPEENELVFRHCDLKELSDNLGQLRGSGRYTDLILKAKDSDQAFPVHSFMLRARWNNFFTEHPDEDVVQTGISKRLLTRILKYIYQGRGRQIPRVDVEKSELCEVIDRYRLHHLYKTFLPDDSRQERRSKQDGPSAKECLLDYTTKNPDYTWVIGSRRKFGELPEIDFRMKILFHLNRDNPQFSYTLESRTPDKRFVRLALEMKATKYVGSRAFAFQPVYLEDFVLEPNETKNCPGDGSLLGFEDKKLVRWYLDSWSKEPAERNWEYSIFVFLTLGTGAETLEFRVTDQDYSFQENKKMYDVLSNHMSELMNQEDDHDFRVSCPGENGRETHRLHKAIFAARVPKYWDVLEGVEEESEIPDEAECTLSSEAFRYVRQYIYTGKVDRIPDRLRVEIADFADRGGIHGLNALALKMINEGRRR